MSRSSTSFNSYTNGNYGRQTIRNAEESPQDYTTREISRTGGLDENTPASANVEEWQGSVRAGSDVDTDDAYTRFRPDRRDLDTSFNSGNGRKDWLDPQSSRGSGRGPGARQIEGQQLLRRKFYIE